MLPELNEKWTLKVARTMAHVHATKRGYFGLSFHYKTDEEKRVANHIVSLHNIALKKAEKES